MAVVEEGVNGTERHNPLTSLIAEVDADSRRWRLSSSGAMALIAMPAVLVLVTAVSFTSKPVFRALTREDGLFEWAQFAAFAAGALGAALVSHRLARHGMARWGFLFGLAAFGLLVVAGEEISWGQRLLDYDTPHELAEINSQGEPTIHNIGAAQELFKAAELAVALFGMLTPLVMRTRFRPRHPAALRFGALAVPPLVLVPAFAVMAGYRIARYTVLPETWATVEATETAELCLALGIAVLVFLLAQRLRHEIPDERGSWIVRAQ